MLDGFGDAAGGKRGGATIPLAPHSDRPVIPVIIDGIFPDNFPQALRFEIASDGSVTDRPVTILGPDLREEADGRQLGLAKIVAGLTDVGSDDIYRRAERARRAADRFRNAVIAVLAILTVASRWRRAFTLGECGPMRRSSMQRSPSSRPRRHPLSLPTPTACPLR